MAFYTNKKFLECPSLTEREELKQWTNVFKITTPYTLTNSCPASQLFSHTNL
jgi:hypothetical protein